jgi:hypothetical protein
MEEKKGKVTREGREKVPHGNFSMRHRISMYFYDVMNGSELWQSITQETQSKKLSAYFKTQDRSHSLEVTSVRLFNKFSQTRWFRSKENKIYLSRFIMQTTT